MNFKPEYTDDFIRLFESVRDKIQNMEGCKGVRLLRDIHNPNIFFTYSLWETESYLEMYRHSELFKDTWTKTKSLFNHKAEAWSLQEQ